MEQIMERKNITLIAITLILFILVSSVVLHITGAGRKGKFRQKVLWEAPVGGSPPETLKVIDLDGDGRDEVFAQTPEEIAVFSFEGEKLLSLKVADSKTTMGDFNGDGVDEFAVAWPEGSDLKVAVYNIGGEKLWESLVPSVGRPTRGTSLDFEGDGRREVVFGTQLSYVVCLDGATGQERWRYQLVPGIEREDIYVRGMDDALVNGKAYLAAASYSGVVNLLDGQGQVVWENTQFPGYLRRLRAGDMDGDGTSEIMLGGSGGTIWLLSARDGGLLWEEGIASKVTEARFLNVDDDPTTLELVVGGKKDVVVAFNRQGERLWTTFVIGKVLELKSFDYNLDGKPELLVGTSLGSVELLKGATCDHIATFWVEGVNVLDVGDFRKKGAYVAGYKDGVAVFKPVYIPPPWWYTPLLPGFLLAVVVGVLAVLATRLQKAPKVTYTIQEMSLEALKARKKMLREVLEDVKRMHQSGQLDLQAYLAQSRSLREQLAAVETQLLKLQPDYKPELLKCPSCGAPLEIGLDRCPYCGQVLL
ncbi:MAG: hypothetical protein DRI61_11225 [Chloroflexi bacterium]|nr:MAG: hypothetical protein DRI61_11225 [Chloroflexota bacterium]